MALKFTTKEMVMCAICVSIAMLLQLVPALRMPQGGSLTFCSMFFIVLAGYWFGPVKGILTGVVFGVLDYMLSGTLYYPLQVVVDYPLAFGLLGLSGFFRKIPFGLQVGYVVGVIGRYSMHVISGIVFFAEYAPETQHVFVYSAIYNSTYIWPEVVLTLIIISIPAFKKALDRVGV